MDIADIIKSSMAALVMLVLGLIFLGMVADLLPGSQPEGKITIVNESRPEQVQAGSSSGIRVLALVLGTAGPLALAYLIIRHVGGGSGTYKDPEELYDMVSAVVRLQEKQQEIKPAQVTSPERRRISGKSG